MTESEKAKLIIEISKLQIICKEHTNVMNMNNVIACVKIQDVLKLISDWSVEE